MIEPWIAALAAVVGYLSGSISMARIVTRLVAPHEDITQTDIKLESTGETYHMHAVAGTTVSLKLGAKWGGITAILDILKAFIPTLVFRLLYPGAPYAIITALGQLSYDSIPARLEQKGLYIWPVKQLNAQQQDWLTNYFTHHIYPVLTPLAVDPGRPFPYLSSDSLNLLIVLQPPAEQRIISGPLYARIKVPRQVVPRLVPIPAIGMATAHIQPAAHFLVWSEEIIRYFADQLFPGMAVTAIYQFRLLRAHITSDPAHPGSGSGWGPFRHRGGWPDL